MAKYFTPALIACTLAGAALITLVIILWPPDLLVGFLLALLLVLLAITTASQIMVSRRARPDWSFRPDRAHEMSEADLAEWRRQALIEKEQQLEFRELRLARTTRALQQANEDYLDVLEKEPSEEELSALVESDRKLIALIEKESQLALDRVLENRYSAPDGVNSELILDDLKDFVRKVANLYRPDQQYPLLDTDIEIIAKSLSSTAMHLLIVVDDLPINLKSYNVARMYRLIRRGASYYGTYKTFRPFIEQGMNLVQIARIAFGVNPAAAGAAWAAGKLSTYGAKAIGERVLQRKALQLLTDMIRVIGFEAAMIYSPGFRRRDANWILGATLVNLEVARTADVRGRDAALVKLCNLALRHEFDRARLLHHLGKKKPVPIRQSQTIMTETERANVAEVLTAHCQETGVIEGEKAVIEWLEDVQQVLGEPLDLSATAVSRQRPVRSRVKRLLNRVRRKDR